MSTRSTYTNVSVRRDASGELISIRPDQLLVPLDTPSAPSVDQVLNAVKEAVRAVCDPDAGLPEFDVRVLCELRNRTTLYLRIESIENPEEPISGFEILDVIDHLRNRPPWPTPGPILAQPDHVYFVSARASSGQFNPNTFTPNTFTPNTFTPNTFTPNTFTPNTFTPNTFTPNTFTAGVLRGAFWCSDRCEGPDSIDLTVPRLAARPVPEPLRRGAEPIAEQHVDVHVLDIASPGLVNTVGWTGEYALPVGDARRPAEAAVDENIDQNADPATAHGDFIVSIISLEGGLTSHLWQSADALGDISDGDLIVALERIAQEDNGLPRVLNLSLSGYHTGDVPEEKELVRTIKTMIEQGWVIVAAAGNNADCRPAMPAAIDGVISVGAISPCGPAWFSNYGWWVDVSAPGTNVIAEWPTLDPGAGTPQEPESGSDMAVHGHLIVGNGQDPHHLEDIRPLCLADFDTGWAFWSGTSFAAPFVVARIARTIHDLIVDGAPTGTPAERQHVIDNAIHHSIYRDDIPWFPNYGRILT